jgi:hypothetical protein
MSILWLLYDEYKGWERENGSRGCRRSEKLATGMGISFPSQCRIQVGVPQQSRRAAACKEEYLLSDASVNARIPIRVVLWGRAQ